MVILRWFKTVSLNCGGKHSSPLCAQALLKTSSSAHADHGRALRLVCNATIMCKQIALDMWMSLHRGVEHEYGITRVRLRFI